MSGRFGKCSGHKPVQDGESKPAPTPQPTPDNDDEEDGDIATPKRDRDDEAGL